MKASRIFLLLLVSFLSFAQEENSDNSETDTDYITSNVGLPSVDVNSSSFLITRTEVPWDIQTQKAYISSDPEAQSKRVALFGDTHVHTTYSFDAYSFGTTANPANKNCNKTSKYNQTKMQNRICVNITKNTFSFPKET